MRQFAIILALAVAPMAGKVLTSAIGSLPWPVLTAIGITMFSGFFIFTIMTAKTPVQIQWKPQVRISPETMEHARNVVQLLAVLILFFATAVILVALADTGHGQTFLESLVKVIKCVPRMLDV